MEPLRALLAELLAAKSAAEVERVLGALRAEGPAALRAAATALARAYLSLRLQRVAIALVGEVGGVEGEALVRVLLTATNVDTEEQTSAVRALGEATSVETVAALLDCLATSANADAELEQTILERLARMPQGFDWPRVAGALRGAHLRLVRPVLARAAPPTLATLVAAVDTELHRAHWEHPNEGE